MAPPCFGFDSDFNQGKHEKASAYRLLEIKKAAVGDPQSVNGSFDGQVYFPPEVLEEARRFEEQHLLTGPTENRVNQDNGQ